MIPRPDELHDLVLSRALDAATDALCTGASLLLQGGAVFLAPPPLVRDEVHDALTEQGWSVTAMPGMPYLTVRKPS